MSDKSKDLGSLSISDEFDRFAKLDDNLDGGFAVQLDVLQTGAAVTNNIATNNRELHNYQPLNYGATNYAPVNHDHNNNGSNNTRENNVAKIVHHIGGFSRPG